MSISLGDLLLKLRIDPSVYNQQIEQARVGALQMGAQIEQAFTKSVNISVNTKSVQSIHKDLDLIGKHWVQVGNLMQAKPLTPKVDDRALTELNKHLDKKQQHWIETWDLLDSEPLTPKVNDQALTELNQTLTTAETHHQTTTQTIAQTPITPKADTSAIDKAQHRITAFTKQLRSVSQQVDNTIRLTNTIDRVVQISIQADTSSLDIAFDKLNLLKANASISVDFSTSGSASGGSSGIESSLKSLPKQIGQEISRQSKPGLLDRIGSIVTAPMRLAGRAIAETASGALFEVGAGFARGTGMTRTSTNAGKATTKSLQAIDQHLLGVEEMSAAFLAEFLRTGNPMKGTEKAFQTSKAAGIAAQFGRTMEASGQFDPSAPGMDRRKAKQNLDQFVDSLTPQEAQTIAAKYVESNEVLLSALQQISGFTKETILDNIEDVQRMPEIREHLAAEAKKKQPNPKYLTQQEKLELQRRQDANKALQMFVQEDSIQGFVRKNAPRMMSPIVTLATQREVPQEFIQQFLNPTLQQLAKFTDYIGRIQAHRTVYEAEKVKNNVLPLFPELKEGQTGYVQMIGGAQFAGGEGHRKLTAWGEGLFPDRRVIGVSNPDLDPGSNPSPLIQGTYDFIAGLVPTVAENKELKNTLMNALTMAIGAINPAGFSQTTATALGNMMAAQERGADMNQFATVSYSLGGVAARNLAEIQQRAGFTTNVHALAFPDINPAQKQTSNFTASVTEADALAGFKTVLGIGGNQNLSVFNTGGAPGAAAHGPQHYFKHNPQIATFYQSLGMAMPQSSRTSEFVTLGQNFYEMLGASAQVRHLSTAPKPELDPNLPLKAFSSGEIAIADGASLIAKYLESLERLTGGSIDMIIEDETAEPIQRAIASKVKQHVLDTFPQFTQFLSGQGFDITSDTTPKQLIEQFAGIPIYQKEYKAFNAVKRSFATGKIAPEDKESAYFAGDFEPTKLKQRMVDVEGAIAHFSRPDILPDKTQREKIVGGFKNIKRMMEEFIETGRVSKATIDSIPDYEPIAMSEDFEKLLSQKIDSQNAPSIESTRRYKQEMPQWAYKSPSATVAYNRMLSDTGNSPFVPPAQQIKFAAYGMSGATALIDEDHVYKNDIGDPAKVASQSEVAAYQQLAGRFAPLLEHAEPGKLMITERVKGTPAKDYLDRIAIPAKQRQQQVQQLKAQIDQAIADGLEPDKALVQQLQLAEKKFAKSKALFNKQAAELYRKIGQLGTTFHSMGVAHNDLASGNVFLMPDGSLTAIDLGNSTVNPDLAGRLSDQATTMQRAVVDNAFWGILDPAQAMNAVREGYAMKPLALPPKRQAAPLPQYKGDRTVEFGSNDQTMMEYLLDYRALAEQYRANQPEAVKQRIAAELPEFEKALENPWEDARSYHSDTAATYIQSRAVLGGRDLELDDPWKSKEEIRQERIQRNLNKAKQRATKVAEGAKSAAGAVKDFVFNPDREITIDMDKLSDFAEKTGTVIYQTGLATAKALDATTRTFNAIAGSDTGQALIGGMSNAIKAIGGVAKAGYQLAEGMESLALDLLPAGRTAKGLLQQTVVPAIALAGASHVPMLGPAVQTATTMGSEAIGMALSPLTHAIDANLITNGTELIGKILPQMEAPKMLGHALPGAQQTVDAINLVRTNALTSMETMVHGATNLIQGGVAEIAATIGGGKVLTTVAERTVGGVVGGVQPLALPGKSAPALPATRSLALPPSESILGNPQIEGAAMRELQDLTKKQLAAIAKQYGVNARGNKNDLIARLEQSLGYSKLDPILSNIDQILDRSGKPIAGYDAATEKAMLAKFKATENAINQKLRELKKATGDQRKQLLESLYADSHNLISELEATKRSFLSGKTAQAIGQTQGRVENIFRNTPELNEARTQRIEQARQSAENAGAQTIDVQTKRLARVSAPNMMQRIRGFFQRPQSIPELTETAQNTFEAFYKQAAQVAKVDLSKMKMPTIRVDNKLLESLGQDAFYDIENNLILVKSDVAKALDKGAIAISSQRKRLAGLTHELAHAFQTEGGALSIESASVRTDYQFREAALDPAQQRQVNASIEAARQADPTANIDAIERLERDAYLFEDETGNIARRVQRRAMLQKKNEATDPISKEIHDVTAGFKAGYEASDRFRSVIGGIFNQFEESYPGVARMVGGVKSLAIGFLAFQGAQIATQFLAQFTAQASQAALEMQRLERVINFTSGGGAKGAENIAQLKRDANRLGLDQKASIAGFAQFSASTKETPLEGDTTMRMFNNVQAATANYGLTPERQKLVYEALSQMASKGVISMEELRGQLGESLPGAINIMARSLGVTTGELGKLVASGELLASDVLPKFTQQLGAESQSGIAASANSAQASLNKLNNKILDLQVAIGQGILSGQKIGADAAVMGLDALTKVLTLLLKILPAVSLMFAGKFLVGLTAGKALIPLISSALGALGNTLMALLPTIAAFAAKFLIVQTIIDVLGMVGKAMSDQGGKFREFADTAKESLNQYELALQSARKSQEGFVLTLPKTSKDVKGESLLEGTLVGQVAGFVFGDRGKQAVRGAEQTVQRTLGLRTFAEEQATDRSIAMNELLGTRGETSYRITDQITRGSSELNQVKRIDQQIEAIQARRRAIAATNPNDRAGIRDLKSQEDALLAQRETLSKPIALLQQSNAGEIETYKNSIKELNQLASEGKITQSEYTEKMTAFQNALKGAQQDQDRLNQAVRLSVNTLESFERAWSKIVDRLEDAQTALTKTGNQTRKAIAQAELSGATQGSSQFKTELLQQDQLREKIRLDQQAIQQMRSELSVQDVDTVRRNYNITDQTGAAELKRRSEEATDPKTKSTLTRLAELSQIETQITASEAELAEAQVAAKRRLIDLTKQVQDFYRGIARQAEETALATRDTQNQVAMINAKMKLKQALTGFQDDYITQFADSLISAIEQFNEPLKQAIEANRQIAAQRNRLEDTLRQGGELQKQMPTGYDGMGADGISSSNPNGAGGAVRSGLYSGPSHRIGGSSEYHIDTKFSRDLSLDQKVKMFDQMAAAYRTQGRKIEFSNAAVSGLVYDERAAFEERKRLLDRALNAHHSQDRDRQNGVRSVDYYLPKIGGNRFDQSVEGAEVLLPHIPGAKLDYAMDGGYGNYVNIYDASGKYLMSTGHGDNARALPSDRTLSANAPQQASAPRPSSTATNGGAGHVVIPLDHTRVRIPDKTGGSTFKASGQTGAAYKGFTERDFQDSLAVKAKAQLEAQGYRVTVLKPESFRSFEEYDQAIAKLSQQQRTVVTPLHYDARMSGYKGGYLTRSRAGDSADNQLSTAIFQNIKKKVGSHASSAMVGADTAPNATIKAAAAAPAALVEFGAMADLVDRYGGVQQYLRSTEFKGGLQGYVAGINQFFGNRPTAQPQQQLKSSQSVRPSVGHAGGMDRRAIDSLFVGGSNSPIAKIIGMAEGNRTASGGYTQHARGHVDPGNGAHNIGSFSAQGAYNKGSIEASDRAVIDQKLKPAVARLQTAAQKQGVSVTPKLLLNFLDTINQGGAQVAYGWSDRTRGLGFLGKLGSIRGRENDDAALRELRMESYRNTGGRMEVASIFKDRSAFSQDQKRRMDEIDDAMKAFNHLLPTSSNRSSNVPPVATMMPTTGMTQGQVEAREGQAQEFANLGGQIDEATQIARRELQQSEQNIRELANARGQEGVFETERTKRRAARQLETAGRDQRNKTRSISEQLEDIAGGLGDDTPSKAQANELRQIARQHRERTESIDLAIRDTSEALANAEGLYEQIKDNPLLKDMGATLLKERDSLRQQKEQLLKNRQQNEELGKKVLEDAKRKSAIEEENRSFQVEQDLANKQIENLRSQATQIQTQAQRPGTLGVNRFGLQQQSLKLNYDADLAEAALKAKQFEFNLKEQERTQKVTAEEAAKLRAEYERIAAIDLSRLQTQFENQTAEIEKQREQLQFDQSSRVFQSEMSLNNAYGTYASTMGFDYQAKQYQQRAAVAQENFNYMGGLREINQWARDTGAAPEVVAQLKTNLEQLNQVNLQNIAAQFNPLNDALKSVKGAFQGFMGDLISGSTSAEDAFNKMIDGILQSLSALAAQLITEQILGSLFGLGGRGGGLFGSVNGIGGAGAGVGGIITSLLGFSEGGLVPEKEQNLRDRSDAIGQALRKEGSNSVLATLTPGEMVLNVAQTRRYLGMGLHRYVERPESAIARVNKSEQFGRIYGFATGGIVPGGASIRVQPTTNISGDNVSVPIQINSGNGEKPSINLPKMRDAVRSAVVEELRRQKRGGGELNS